MEGMSWQEALNVLEAVKSRYQAFDQLEGVARLMAGQEQRAGELRAALVELEREVAQRRRLAKTLQDKEGELERLIKGQTEKYQKEQQEWTSRIRELELRYEGMTKELKEAHEGMKQMLDGEYNQQRNGFLREIAGLEARKAQLERQIEEVKQRIGGL